MSGGRLLGVFTEKTHGDQVVGGFFEPANGRMFHHVVRKVQLWEA